MELTLFLILVALCAFAKAQMNRKDVLEETAPGYTIARYAGLLNSTDCRRDLEKFRDGVDQRKLWAIELLDANGAPGTGFLYGNIHWVGKRRQCYDIMETKSYPINQQALENFSSRYSTADQYPPFQTAYYSVTVGQNSSMVFKIKIPSPDNIRLGVCVPASCSTDDVGIILKKIFRDRTLLAGDIYDMDFTLLAIRDVNDVSNFLLNGKMICILMIICTILAISIIGTLYDLLVYQKRQRAGKILLTIDNGNTSELKQDAEIDEKNIPILPSQNCMEQVMMCFSVYNNTKSIFDSSKNDEHLSAINGIRVLSMLWLILIHIGYFGIPFLDNRFIFLKMLTRFDMQLLVNGYYAADSFFCISGFLLMYLFLKREKGRPSKTHGFRGNIKELLLLIFKRFVRLTPMYMAVIAIAILNFSWYNRTSTLSLFEKIPEVCSKYWWTNLLYINNLLPLRYTCMAWSWYLSNDMQFYIFGTILLLLSRKYFYPAMIIGGGTIVASVVFTGYTAYIYSYTLKLDELYQLASIVYFPPWIRIPPYLVGMGAGYFLHRCNGTLHLKKSTLIICWCVAVISGLIILFATYNQHMTPAECIIYLALGKTVWSIDIAWLMIACITNNAGIMSKIFAAKVWIPLSRITYGAYLLNPVFINTMWLYSDVSWHMEMFNTGVVFPATAIATYFAGYVASVTTELPFTSLFQLFFNSGTRRM